MLETEMHEHPGYEKNSVSGSNSGSSRSGYGTKATTSDYGECEIAIPRDRNGEFEPKVIETRRTRTDEAEQKLEFIALQRFFRLGFQVLVLLSTKA